MAAAVIAVVVHDHGEGLVGSNGLALIGHGDDARAFRLRVVDHIGEAVAVNDVIIGQVAGVDIGLAGGVRLDLRRGKLEPLMDLLALHGDLIEPVFKAVKLKHIAEVDVALVDDVCIVAGGQRRGDGELRRLVVLRIVRRVHAGVVISAPELDGVDQIHERRRLCAELGSRKISVGLADLLEHVLLPCRVLIGLENLDEVFVELVVLHIHQRGVNVGLAGRLVVGDLHLRDGTCLGERLEHMDVLALGVLDRPILVVMLMAGECKGDGVRLLNELLDEVGFLVGIHAAVGSNDDHVGLFLHFRLIVLIGVDDVGKIDAFPVGGNIPCGDIGVAEADDGNLHAAKVLDDVGGIALPRLPVLALVAVGGGVEIVGHADAQLLFRFRAGGSGIIKLTVEDVQTVVELVVADNPHVIADGTECLDRRGIGIGLVERIVIRQRSTLDGVAQVGNIQIVAVFLPHFLDVRRDAGQATFIGAAFGGVDRIIRREDLTVQVGRHKECKVGFALFRKNRRQSDRIMQSTSSAAGTRVSFFINYSPFQK